MKKIAILTSGGDAPGMNAAIRACVLAASHHQYECIGFYHGYNGLINQESVQLCPTHIRQIIHQGGTILKSARCPEMLTEAGINQAVSTLLKEDIDALIVIGGDGSFSGALAISKHWRGTIIGIPGTIDNDLDGTEFTIGFATAVNTGIEAIDKIRDTADAFERVFIVELMGRHSGHIAFNVGIACGAEQILSFENTGTDNIEKQLTAIANDIKVAQQQRHQSYIIVLAENLWQQGPQYLVNKLKDIANIDSTVCVLGHIQRGGSPVAKDRILATKMGVAAIQAVADEESMQMVAEQNNQIQLVPFTEAIKHNKKVQQSLVLAQQNILSINPN